MFGECDSTMPEEAAALLDEFQKKLTETMPNVRGILIISEDADRTTFFYDLRNNMTKPYLLRAISMYYNLLVQEVLAPVD